MDAVWRFGFVDDPLDTAVRQSSHGSSQVHKITRQGIEECPRHVGLEELRALSFERIGWSVGADQTVTPPGIDGYATGNHDC